MPSVSRLSDLIPQESFEPLEEYFTHSHHHNDVQDELVQPLWKQNKQEHWQLSVSHHQQQTGIMLKEGKCNRIQCCGTLER